MVNKNDQDQVFKAIEKLPETVREIFFSEKTADSISSACEEYKIPGEKTSKVAHYVGRVLLGFLSPAGLPDVLEKDAGLKKELAQGIAREISLSIFSQIGMAKTAPQAQAPSAPSTPPKKADTYREPVV